MVSTMANITVNIMASTMANITVNIMASTMDMRIIISYGYEGGT